MYYAIADIHGCYKQFDKMLDLIGFSNENDVLFVLGDVVDRGFDSMRVIDLMMKNDHIVPIMGNHDLMAYQILNQFETKVMQERERVRRKDLKAISRISEYWFSQGGIPTLVEYCKLKKYVRTEILKYIGDFLPCFEITVNNKRFVMVHAGIHEFDSKKNLIEYKKESFLYDRADYSKVYFKDKYLVTGHTPTDIISQKYCGKIYMKNNHIAIDCGTVFGNGMGCIRLNDFKEYYVD